MDTASPSNVTHQQQVSSRETICQEAETRALFAALDKDSNGFIDKNELRVTMSEVGLQLSDDDIDTMMKAAGVVIKDRIFYEGRLSTVLISGTRLSRHCKATAFVLEAKDLSSRTHLWVSTQSYLDPYAYLT